MSRGGRQWPVNDHDVLGGRGVSFAQHKGNERFRALVFSRSDADYCNSYTTAEKKAIAAEIVDHINSLDPPGRFLRRPANYGSRNSRGSGGQWEELTRDEAIKKTCQALRDCNRRDRSGYGSSVLQSGNLPPDVEQVRQTHAESGLTRKQLAAMAAASSSKRKAETQLDIPPLESSSAPRHDDISTPQQPATTTQHDDSHHRRLASANIADFAQSLMSIEQAPPASSKRQRYLPDVTPSTAGVAAAASMNSSPDDYPSVFGDSSPLDPLTGFELATTFDEAKSRTCSFDDSKPRASSIEGLDVDEAYAAFSADHQDFGPPSPPYHDDPTEDHSSYQHDT